MTSEDTFFLYRGTTLSRFEDRWTGNSDFPGNWTDDPLQGASYALGYSLGDSHNNVPVVLVTEFNEPFFESGVGVPTYFPEFKVESDRMPDWYRHKADERFCSEDERDQAPEMFDLNDLDDFIARHLSEISEDQKSELRHYFDYMTSFERYEEVREQDG